MMDWETGERERKRLDTILYMKIDGVSIRRLWRKDEDTIVEEARLSLLSPTRLSKAIRRVCLMMEERCKGRLRC